MSSLVTQKQKHSLGCTSTSCSGVFKKKGGGQKRKQQEQRKTSCEDRRAARIQTGCMVSASSLTFEQPFLVPKIRVFSLDLSQAEQLVPLGAGRSTWLLGGLSDSASGV